MGWQVTAITVYCDAVDDEITLLLYKDGATTCSGYKKYAKPNRETVNLLEKKSKQLKRQLKCEGQECCRVIQYKDKVLAKEAKRGAQSEATEK
jgi:hypothetical protein